MREEDLGKYFDGRTNTYFGYSGCSSFLYFYFFSSPPFLGPHLQHMEVLGLGVESELQLQAYATVTATANLNP